MLVHRKFTNTHLAFCQKNVRCMVRGRLGAAESKILPRCQISHFAHSVPSESCWGVPSPNPAIRSLTAAATSPSDRALQAPSPRKVLKTARTATSSRSQHRKVFLIGILNKRQIFVRCKVKKKNIGTKPGADSLSKVERFSEIFSPAVPSFREKMSVVC